MIHISCTFVPLTSSLIPHRRYLLLILGCNLLHGVLIIFNINYFLKDVLLLLCSFFCCVCSSKGFVFLSGCILAESNRFYLLSKVLKDSLEKSFSATKHVLSFTSRTLPVKFGSSFIGILPRPPHPVRKQKLPCGIRQRHTWP